VTHDVAEQDDHVLDICVLHLWKALQAPLDHPHVLDPHLPPRTANTSILKMRTTSTGVSNVFLRLDNSTKRIDFLARFDSLVVKIKKTQIAS
jgi:hypothetical protein